MFKITLAKVMGAIVLGLLLTNIHLYQSRNNALERIGEIEQRLSASQKQTKDAVAVGNQNAQALSDALVERDAVLAQISVLNERILAQKSVATTQEIEVIKYVERSEGFVQECLNMPLPEHILSGFRVQLKTN